MITTLSRFLADESGATAVDTARILALAIVGLVGVYDILGPGIGGLLGSGAEAAGK